MTDIAQQPTTRRFAQSSAGRSGRRWASVDAGPTMPRQTIDAGGLSSRPRRSGRRCPPSRRCARPSCRSSRSKGDDDPAELVVFAFPGGAGTVDANVKRWQSQFKDTDGNPPKIESKTVKGKNVEVTRVETAGPVLPVDRSPAQPGARARQGHRLLGAIVVTEQVGYFSRWSAPTRPWPRSAPRSTSCCRRSRWKTDS